MPSRARVSRRIFLSRLALKTVAAAWPFTAHAEESEKMITRPIPGSGQHLPVIGMGSHITFNVGRDRVARLQRTEVLRTFFDMGGQMVDSSPMYGSPEEVLGFCIEQLGRTAGPLFSATKVWTRGKQAGLDEIAASHALWGVQHFKLNQLHNLVDWRTQLDTLLQIKADGRLQYVGITTSLGRRHGDLEQFMRSQPIDFVQLSYKVDNRSVEERLLPLARDRGIAVIVNRPFMKGRLLDRYQHQALPPFAAEFDCENWAQFFLKFVVSHPSLTCAIPATARVDHMWENMGACYGRLPTPQQRKQMLGYIQSL